MCFRDVTILKVPNKTGQNHGYYFGKWMVIAQDPQKYDPQKGDEWTGARISCVPDTLAIGDSLNISILPHAYISVYHATAVVVKVIYIHELKSNLFDFSG